MKYPLRFIRTYRLLIFGLISMSGGLLCAALHHGTMAHWIISIATAIALIPLLKRMWNEIRNDTYGVDILACTAIVCAVILKQYEATAILVILLGAMPLLKDLTGSILRSDLRKLQQQPPTIAHVMRKHKIIDTTPEHIVLHEKITIHPGEIVPVDAIILEGESTFDERGLTGAQAPLHKQVGESIVSGSLNVEGIIIAQAVRPAKDSQYQQAVRLRHAAAEHAAPFVRLADRYSLSLIIAAYAIGGVAWILSHHAVRFLEVIIVVTPFSLVVGAPLALIAGLSRAARDGMVVKTGNALELLASAKTFAFDASTTLASTPSVHTVVSFSSHTEQEVLVYAASVAQRALYPQAIALTHAAATSNYKLFKAKHVQELPGHGLEARIGNHTVLVGGVDLLATHNISLPQSFRLAKLFQSAIFVGVNGVAAGYISFTSPQRTDAKRTIRWINHFGAAPLLFTGDHLAAARVTARQLDVTTTEIAITPADKLRNIEHAAARPTAYITSSSGDTSILLAADVGIALGARDETANNDAADILILPNSFSHVALAIAIARKAFRLAMRSIYLGIGLNVICIAAAVLGIVTPTLGAGIQALVDILILIYVLCGRSLVRDTAPYIS